MHTSSHLESQQELIIYPRLVWAGKKQLLLGVPVCSLFVIGSIFTIVTGQGKQLLIEGWVGALFFSFILVTLLVQLNWGSFLIVNKQGIRIRPNPFLSPMILHWDEIASITPSRKRGDFYFDIALSSTHLEAFLQRQSPFNRKVIARRLSRIQHVARFPQRFLPCSLFILLEAIEEQYHVQLQQHHILLETQIAPKKRPSREKRYVFFF